MGISILEREAEAPTIFKDRSKLSPDYVPSYLPCRESEYRLLAQIFRLVLKTQGAVATRALIRGRIGTGKTALAKRFGYDFELLAQQRGLELRFKYVNCRKDGSFYNLLRDAIESLEGAFPRRGFSAEEALHALLYLLRERRYHLVLAIDEVEALIRREGSTPLYNLFRSQEVEGSSRISIICILREPECYDVLKSLDASTHSFLQHNVVHLSSYTSAQLQEIVWQRVKEAFKEDAVEPSVVGLISDLAGEYGSARYAIELLERAGIYADMERGQKVLPRHVRLARATLPPELRKDVLLTLDSHERMMLLALARQLKNCTVDYVTMGRLKHEYEVVCEEYGRRSLGYTQFWKRLKNVADLGMITAKASGKGFKGRTTLVGLPIPPELLEEALEKMLP